MLGRINTYDLGGLARELLQERENLNYTAGVLTQIANALRVHEKKRGRTGSR